MSMAKAKFIRISGFCSALLLASLFTVGAASSKDMRLLGSIQTIRIR